MKVKNKKTYIFLGVLLLWTILLTYLKQRIDYIDIINYLFWSLVTIICIIEFRKEYKRDKLKTIIFKDILIFILLYVIIYYSLGIIIGFKRSPLNFELYSIIINIMKYVSLRAFIEIVKYYLIKENNSKTSVILITILFIIINIDINHLLKISEDKIVLFKYISSTIIPTCMYGIIGTYLMKYTDLKTNLLLQLTPLVLTYTIKISPNLDWYFYGMFHIVFLSIIYLFIKYEIDKKEETKKEAKESIVSLIPIIVIFTVLILFVLGAFKYVPLGVMSNSMKPLFERGDTVIYEKIKNKDTIKENDIICYNLDGIKVMHRVVKIEEINNEKYYTTKGDNLITKDPLKVTQKQIIGKIKFTIPRIGYPSVWLYEFLK